MISSNSTTFHRKVWTKPYYMVGMIVDGPTCLMICSDLVRSSPNYPNKEEDKI